jgi:NAD(P)H dehydrogenase (quinone)
MKTLVIVAHPNPASFNKNGIVPTVVKTLEAKGHEVKIRDLYEINFNPVLSGADFAALQSGNIPADIAEEQEHISWATNLVIVSPIWWIGRPALLQGYYDRVFSYGFAFEYGANGAVGLLKNENALIINTAGTPEGVYDMWPDSKALLSRPSVEGVFGFCGIKNVQQIQFYGLPNSSDADREAMLQQVADSVGKL